MAATRRPQAHAVMRQKWRHLLFLHWEVPAEALRPLVPDRLAIDTFEGQAYVGLVAFTMKGIRPPWLPPLPVLSRFHEVNVRTYVHLDGREPGVFFFSLDAASRLAVLGARAFFRLPYHFASITLRGGAAPAWLDYASDRRWPGPMPARCHLRYRGTGPVAPARSRTLEHFLAERYLLYTTDGPRLLVGRVHHSPYPLQSAEVGELDESLLAAAGIRRPAAPPLVFYASGVDVEVFALEIAGAIAAAS